MANSQPLRTMMVDTQVRPSDVTKFPIIAAMLDVPRENYVPASAVPVAYMDAPVPLGGGREMPEARTLAKMLDALDVEQDDTVLIVGGGLGYSAAVLARMAGSVVMIEDDATLASEAEATLTAHDVDNAAVVQADLTGGAPKSGPYDVILIEGGVESVPQTLTDQLSEDGRIAAIFQTGALGEARVGYMAKGKVAWRFAFNATAPVLPGFAAARTFVL
ncbi:protein-L-isoaspartate O-methyltransferase [Jannaschia sp. 2305UL9-9]|uniref:protein-L-isoaspartate O-methyltransferase family protein n=1 Tax=Jannaschia sp. 2305UL9-9 TaxID=3121638 RepID=UPI00352763BA